ncbi:MAG: nucleotidyltransferase family protein [Nitrospirota bacterium]
MKHSVKSVEEVKAILKEHKAEVVQKYRVREIGIFGSFVRGEQKRRSDVDILVTFSGIPDVFRYMELEDYLGKLLRKKVDLVRKEAIRPELKKRILKEAVYV